MSDGSFIQEFNVEFVALRERESFKLIRVYSYKLYQDISEEEFAKKLALKPTSDKTTVDKTKICDIEFCKIDSNLDDSRTVRVVKKIDGYFVEIVVSAQDKDHFDKAMSGFSKL